MVSSIIRKIKQLGWPNPEIVFASQVDLRPSRNGSSDVCPGSVDGLRAVDSDLSTRGESVVSSIRVATDQRRVVSIVADTAA